MACQLQTGAGKTHTMEGDPNHPALRGIIPNSFQHIFDHVSLKGSDEKYLVRASYFEIYNEEIRDLLSTTPKSLDLKESPDSGVYVRGLISTSVKSFSEIDNLMQRGKKKRSVAVTNMNQGSSRSHSVFSVVIECCSIDSQGEDRIRVGKLNLVDLAGSERQAKTGATGDRLKEATKINLSLSALGNVISALVDGKSHHIPYRDSKLTRILADSLGGNTKTVMCANAGPAGYNYDETLSTLRYANRAKNIKNKPVINEDPKDARLREYQDEISKLRSELKNISLNKKSSCTDEGKISVDTNIQLDREKMKKIKKQADKDKAEFEAKSKKELEKLKNEQTKSSEEQRRLQAKLEKESIERAKTEAQRITLLKKLQDMEAQMMIGGEIASNATKQEAALRKAEQCLIAKREKELTFARQMASQEETNLQLEEKYSSLNEEVHSKSKKLKKLFPKYLQAKAEINDLQREFQSERNDMLETIRDLTKQLKLKDLVISNFIPPRYAQLFNDKENGGYACWDEKEDMWVIPRLDVAGNNIQLEQRIVDFPISHNIALDLKSPVRMAQKYGDPDTVPDISKILEMGIDDKVEQIAFVEKSNVLDYNPYLSYTSKKSQRLEANESTKKRRLKSRRDQMTKVRLSSESC